MLTECLLQIGLKVEGIELHQAAKQASTERDVTTSVVIIGMRSSGKTYVGELVAATLGWTFIDMDAYFEQKFSSVIRDYVQRNGWPAFRAAEVKVLKDLLAQYPSHHVLSLGGGIVETPEARKILATYAKDRPVVPIARPVNEIIAYLEVETSRPAFGEPIVDVFKRREPWFAECSSYEFVNNVGTPAPVQATSEGRGLPQPTLETISI